MIYATICFLVIFLESEQITFFTFIWHVTFFADSYTLLCRHTESREIFLLQLLEADIARCQ